MYCCSCGTELPTSARYCPVCGRLAGYSGSSYTETKLRATPINWKRFVIGSVIAVALLSLVLLKDNSGSSEKGRADRSSEPSPTPKPPGTAIEVDVTKLALQPKVETMQILGSPSEHGPGDLEQYPWGFIAFNNGRLDQIDYGYRERPSSVKEALERVGLEQTSQPKTGRLSYYWNSSTGPLICCGLEMDNVVIMADFSGITVGFRKKATPPAEPFSKSSVSGRVRPTGTDALLEASSMGDITAVRKLLINGADVNGTDTGGSTALMKATVNGHVGIVKLLLARGADVNARAENGHTALMSVTKNGAGIAEMLLAAGADANAQRDDSITPLMIAVLNDNSSVVGALLKKGADPSKHVTSAGMFQGWTAEDFANWKQNVAIGRLLHNKTHRLASAFR